MKGTAAMAIGAALLVGCSGDDEEAETTAEATTTMAEATTTTLEATTTSTPAYDLSPLPDHVIRQERSEAGGPECFDPVLAESADEFFVSIGPPNTEDGSLLEWEAPGFGISSLVVAELADGRTYVVAGGPGVCAGDDLFRGIATNNDHSGR